ncbi:hypothetical protein FXF51_32250 [Nonomuraea sp. PA05]|uniref:hypothetical protein n=1 Tax=Nonomuraea sp. PA05 TaxID=2604466 RepID=UPI0011D46A81|nr:hypothetical protein [Nonomuraea sp. PA05]TYB60262.1 hypothetical protein FXF51_32250 [Nonomuraea sp. PA05]
MRKSLTAAGGALLAAAVLFGTAGSVAADEGKEPVWSEHWAKHPQNCGLGMNDDSTYQHVTKHGVFAGTRDADVCKKFESKDYREHWSGDDDDDDDDDGDDGNAIFG